MRLYRALLRLYPASFRREYADEMVALFRVRHRQAGGALGRGLLWVEAAADVVRNAALAHWDILRQDLRYVVRALGRAPGFAITAILLTALGVGANAAAFSVTDYALVRPLPFPESDRLVTLWQHPPGYSGMELSPPNYHDWKAMSRSFAGMGAYYDFALNLAGTETPERVEAAAVEPDLLSVLRVRPALGRAFGADDARLTSPATVILSDPLWRTRFGADPGVLGRVVSLDGAPAEVIGVMPANFRFPRPASQLWVPLRLREDDAADRSNNLFSVVARLGPGVTLEEARADLDVVAARLARLYPDANEKTGATVNRLRDELSERSRLLLLALAGASLCILVIACANLGSLLLARGIARERELAVRTALGAGRERLVRQLVTESLLLAGAGGLVGVLTAWGTVPLLAGLVPDDLPLAGGPGLDLRVLGVAGLATLITCLLFAVLPARRLGTGTDLAGLREGARAGGGRRERTRAALVTVEVAASVVLLMSAGLLLRAIARIQDVDPGFRREEVLTLRTALPWPGYSRVADRERFYGRVLAQVRALPGVREAAYVTAAPLVWEGGIWPATVQGEAEVRAFAHSASLRFVTPGYFATLGIGLRAGRDVDPTDRQDAPYVAVVSESFAKRYWPGRDPLGRTFKMAYAERRIVGVVDDIKARGLERTSEPQVYLPSPQAADSDLVGYWPKDLVIRTAGPPDQLAPAVRRIVAGADPSQPVSDVRTMEQILSSETASRAVQLRILGALAAIALVLAAVGVHGLLSFVVAQRAREIGVRMALGARASAVVRLVLGRALLLTGLGLVVGAALAYPAARAMRAVLFGVPPADLLTLGVVTGLCLAMTVAGCLVPAVRAVRVDPIRALRAE